MFTPHFYVTVGPKHETLLQNSIVQIASALDREQLTELLNRTMVCAESEKLYKMMFNSNSHELRAPISAVIMMRRSGVVRTSSVFFIVHSFCVSVIWNCRRCAIQ